MFIFCYTFKLKDNMKIYASYIKDLSLILKIIVRRAKIFTWFK